MLKWTAIYVAQAFFWFWLAREAWQDRPKRARTEDDSWAVRLWRFDASVIRSFSWAMIALTTLAYLAGLAAVLFGR